MTIVDHAITLWTRIFADSMAHARTRVLSAGDKAAAMSVARREANEAVAILREDFAAPIADPPATEVEIRELRDRMLDVEALAGQVSLWKARAEAALTGDGSHSGYHIPEAMLGRLTRAHVVQWVEAKGWTKTSERWRRGMDGCFGDRWRAVPRDSRGITVWTSELPDDLARAINDVAVHFKLSQWDVLDQMLALSIEDPTP